MNGLCWMCRINLIFQVLLLVSGRGRYFYETWGGSRFVGTVNDPNQFAFFIFIMMLVLFIIGTVNTYLQLYMCMAIGGQWPTSRLGASIAAYFILNFGLQMLTVAGMLVSGVVLAATGAMDALVPMVEHAAPAAVMCAVMGAVGAVLLVGCVIYFCITRWLLTKRLNLA